MFFALLLCRCDGSPSGGPSDDLGYGGLAASLFPSPSRRYARFAYTAPRYGRAPALETIPGLYQFCYRGGGGGRGPADAASCVQGQRQKRKLGAPADAR
ncbi:hypothetical protein MRX96_021405 [Rhipicephalus microplus]